MIRSIFILIFVFAANIIFSQTCSQNSNHPGYKTVIQTTSTETITREYILHIPTNYNEENATPLVINMHGFGDCASDFFESVGNFYGLNELANQENFIIAYPQGAYRPDKDDNYWEPGDNGSANIYENDVYFIEQLIANIDSEYNVDHDKIYACGYSNGGMMAYSLACNRSDVFSAIGIMSGTMLEEDCMLESPVPIVIFHGIADGVLPYEGNFWYQSIAEVVNFWLDKNNIPSSSLATEQLNEGKVVKDEYSGGDENSCLTLYTINEEYDKPGDHVWFSDEINSIKPNKIMWDFFNESCKIINATQEGEEAYSSIKISPNPFVDHILIQSDLSVFEDYEIYNVHGDLVAQGQLNSNTQFIELNQLTSGIYILKIGATFRKILNHFIE